MPDFNMTTLRSVLYSIFLGLSTIVYTLLILLVIPLRNLRLRSKLANNWATVNLWALKIICGLDYQISGLENLPTQNCIIMANHQSTWETIALRSILPFMQTWVIKRELLAIPFFGWASRTLYPIAIDRAASTKALRQLISQGQEALQKGQWVAMFPEGTRVLVGETKKYNLGGALLAEKSGYPIVPIAHNAGLFWRHNSLLRLSGTIQVVIGPPVVTTGKKAAHINKEVEFWINNEVQQLLKRL